MPYPVEEQESVAIDVERLENSMKLQTSRQGLKKKERHMIYRVFHSVRRDHEQDYDPHIIAIGPFHRGKKALEPMEQLKWIYLRQLIRRSPEKNKLHNYIKVVNEVTMEARSYYSEPVALSDEDFVEMLVLDGCFLIEYLVKAYMGENRGRLNGVNWSLPLLQRDLLLLENQFPFPILQLLFNSSDIPVLVGLKEDKTPVTLTELAVSYVTRNKFETLPETSKPDAETLPETSKPDAILHLLHVYHAFMRPTSPSQFQPPCWSCGFVMQRMKNLYLWLFYCLCYVLTGHMPMWCTSNSVKELNTIPIKIPNATRLLEFGVTFKEKQGEHSILDVYFDKEAGIIEIPMLKMLKLHEDTIALFRNILAFEQCCPKFGNHFTSYASLMDSLIDNAADVNILKQKHIIDSNTDEDKEVAEFFNNLCKGSYMDFADHCFLPLFEDVTECCNISHHRWRAELMPYYYYFKKPWAIISIFLIVPTFLQTFYAIYAYYRPP